MEYHNDHPQTDHIDSLLSVLADMERRQIITHLEDAAPDLVTLGELTTHLTTEYGYDPEATRVSLHHNHLPALDDTDILDYDADAKTIQYHGHAGLEPLFNTNHPERTP